MSSASGDLPRDLRCSCLFALIVYEGNCCVWQSCRCHFDLSLLPALPCNVFTCAYLDVYYYLCCLLSGTFNLFYLQISVRMRHVRLADSYLRANIEFRNKACTRGKYYSYTVCISCCSYLYMCTGIYTCVMFLQWLELVCPSYVSVLASSGLHAWTCSCESVKISQSQQTFM